MKTRTIFYLLILLLFGISCDDYLDIMPDNRAEIDSEEKVSKLLVSAYPRDSYILCAELASDNVDNFGDDNPYFSRFLEQLYTWVDVTETNNEDPKRIWEACYRAITNANQALQAINNLGNPENLQPAKGEALIARAYCHFILTNIFCQHYSKEHSGTDLGIPYMEASETDLSPKYERGTVLADYEKIEKDIEEGLQLINDSFYKIPKYHFNKKAAYTFASRFYLFYQKWDKVIEYATVALGSNPKGLLRDYPMLLTMPRYLNNVSTKYVATTFKSNFLVLTAYSNLGAIFGAYYTGSRYNHGGLLAQTETSNQAPWGKFPTNRTIYEYFYRLRPYIYTGTNLDKTLFPRLPYFFEYTDPVSGIGFRRTLYIAFKAEEALLNRAEAYVMLGKYTEALSDITAWTDNTLNQAVINPKQLTEQSIENWAKNYAYYIPEKPTPKKKLNPDFIAIEEGSKQESFIHCILFMRRHEFIHEGMRWFDVKRYGIEIYRRTVNGLEVKSVDDKLIIRDNRRAMQIPGDVVDAGMAPNPR